MDPHAPPEFEDDFDTELADLAAVPPAAQSSAAEAAERLTIETIAIAEPPGFNLFGSDEDRTGELEAVPHPADATQPDEEEASFILSKYRAFYTEILRARQQKPGLAGLRTLVANDTGAEETTPENAARELGWRLQQILELQAAEAKWMRGEAAEQYPEAQYAMVALADEMFTVIDWPGRSAWPRHGLEATLFHSAEAPVEFFSRVDALLRHPAPTHGVRDVGRVYLLALAAGFEGMFREPGLKRPLAEYRRRLYEFIHHQFALALYEPDRTLLPRTDVHTLTSRAMGRFTSAQRWSAVVIVLIVCYLLIAQLAWSKVTADLRDMTARIEAITAAPGAK